MSILEQEQQVTTDTDIVTVTASAASKIIELLNERGIEEHALRVFVAGGGCSGLSYGMAFETDIQEHDAMMSIDGGGRIVVDPTSLMYVRGAVIDFVDSLMGAGFRIDNPNATSSCGCGSSFRTEDHEAGAEHSHAGGCSTCS
jgi:iron-sulfur cluster assembly protein